MTLKEFLIKLVSDEKGNISSGRFLNLIIGLCATLMVWKMVLLATVTSEIWIAWLAYGLGGYGFGKYLDKKKGSEEPPKEEK